MSIKAREDRETAMASSAVRVPLGTALPADMHLPADSVLMLDGAELLIVPGPARWSPTARLLHAQHTEHARRCDAELPPGEPAKPAKDPL